MRVASRLWIHGPWVGELTRPSFGAGGMRWPAWTTLPASTTSCRSWTRFRGAARCTRCSRRECSSGSSGQRQEEGGQGGESGCQGGGGEWPAAFPQVQPPTALSAPPLSHIHSLSHTHVFRFELSTSLACPLLSSPLLLLPPNRAVAAGRLAKGAQKAGGAAAAAAAGGEAAKPSPSLEDVERATRACQVSHTARYGSLPMALMLACFKASDRVGRHLV